jgi:hypothetical protein
MSSLAIIPGFLRAARNLSMMAFSTVCIVSCASEPRDKHQSDPAALTKSTDGKAERRRWEDTVQRDNNLSPTGTGAGYYGSSSGYRITW